jgi:hypothetical protein
VTAFCFASSAINAADPPPPRDKTMPEGKGKPTDFVMILAAALYGEQIVFADEVRGQLQTFGFDCSTQQVAAWLGRMSRKDLPPIERAGDVVVGLWGYRVTQWGRTELWNRGLKNLGMPLSGRRAAS